MNQLNVKPLMNAPLTRNDWVAASHFHDLTEAEVLREVSRRVAQKQAAHPLVLFDLDSTLYEVGPRTHQVLQEWLDSSESKPFIALREAARKLQEKHIGYSIRDTLRAIGLNPELPELQSAIKVIRDFWRARFFSNAYLKYDRPYPGAVEFAREVYESGAELVYLTGRDEPNMGDGTRDNLIRDGFPWNEPRTHLLMKPQYGMSDIQHKTDAEEYIRKHGSLIASFENEPLNLVALSKIFPDAMHVFVDTVASDHPALPAQGLYRIRGFN